MGIIKRVLHSLNPYSGGINTIEQISAGAMITVGYIPLVGGIGVGSYFLYTKSMDDAAAAFSIGLELLGATFVGVGYVIKSLKNPQNSLR